MALSDFNIDEYLQPTIDEGSFTQEEEDTTPTYDYATTQRGFVGDVGSRVYRGLLDLGELVEGVGTSVTKDVSPSFLGDIVSKGRETELAKPDVDEYLGKDSTLKTWFGQAVQAAPTSLAGAGVAIGATALGQPELALPAALLTVSTLFGPGVYGQTYKENIEALGPEEAHKLAIKTSTSELASELPSQLLTLGAGGALFKSTMNQLRKQGTDVTIKNLMRAVSGKESVKQLLKTGAGIGITEVGTEAGNAYYQANELNKAYGEMVVDPTDAAIDAAGTATIMSLMFTGAASTLSSVNKAQLKSALLSDDKAQQTIASGIISKNLKDPEMKAFWNARAQQVLADPDAKFSLDDNFMELGEALINEQNKPITEADILDKDNGGILIKKLDNVLATNKVKTIAPLVTEPPAPKTNVADLAKREADLKAQQEGGRANLLSGKPIRQKEVEIRKFEEELAKQEVIIPDEPAQVTQEKRAKAAESERVQNAMTLAENTKGAPLTAEEAARVFESARLTEDMQKAEARAARQEDLEFAFSEGALVKELQSKIDQGVILSTEELQELAKVRFGSSAAETITDEASFKQPTVTKEQVDRAVQDAKEQNVIDKDIDPRVTVVTMTPEEFLKLNTRDDAQLSRIREYSPEMTAAGKEIAEDVIVPSTQELQDSPSPYIVVDKDGTIVGHEGRSRAVMLENAGSKKYQVTVIAKESMPELIKSKIRDFFVDISPKKKVKTRGVSRKELAGFKEISTAKEPTAAKETTTGSKKATGKSAQVAWTMDEDTKTSAQRADEYIGTSPSGTEWRLIKTTSEDGNAYYLAKTEPKKEFTFLGDEGPFDTLNKGKIRVEELEGFREPTSKKTKSKGKKKSGVLAEDGRAYILEDLANTIYKAGMKIGEFVDKLRSTLGKAYVSIRNKVRQLFKQAQEFSSKIVTGAERGEVVLKEGQELTPTQQKEVPEGEVSLAEEKITEAELEPPTTIPAKEKKDMTVEERAQYNKENIEANVSPEDIGGLTKEKFKHFTSDSKRILKNSFQTVDARVRNLSRKLHGTLQTGEALRSVLHKRWTEAALPFVKEVNKLSSIDQGLLFFGLRNGPDDKFGAYVEAEKIFNANPKLKAEYAKFRKEVIEDAESRLEKTGRLPKKIADWFPSKPKDPVALFNALDADVKSQFQEQLKEEERRRRKKSLPFSDGDKADFIARLFANNRFNKVRTPGNIRQRTITHMSPKLVHLYEDIPTTIASYIGEITEDLAISAMVGRSNRSATLQKMASLEKRILKGEDNLLDEYEKLADSLEDIETDREHSLAQIIGSDKSLSEEEKKELGDLFRARFNQRGTRGAVQTFKNFSLMLTIGNIFSAITQLSDPIFNIYKHGSYAPSSLIGAITDPNKISKFFDFESVMREFTPSKVGSAPALDFMLKWSGLRMMDIYGKEAFLQGAQSKWSKVPLARFEKKFSELFPGKDLSKIQQKLKDEKYEDFDVQNLLFSTLKEVQPISISDAPVYFASGGNLRILYMLKLFSIKAINLTVTEAREEWEKGTIQSKSKAVAKVISLLGMLSLAGAGTDDLKDIILGRKTEKSFSDKMFLNLMQLAMLNQMSIEKGLKTGNIIETVLSNNLPATRIPSQFITDIVKTAQGDLSYKSMSGLPLVGKITYEGAFGLGGTALAKEADMKRLRRSITEGIQDALDDGVSTELRNNVKTFNKDARKFGMKPISISKLLRQARKGERKGD